MPEVFSGICINKQMKKIKNKYISLFMAGVMCLTSISPSYVMAEENIGIAETSAEYSSEQFDTYISEDPGAEAEAYESGNPDLPSEESVSQGEDLPSEDVVSQDEDLPVKESSQEQEEPDDFSTEESQGFYEAEAPVSDNETINNDNSDSLTCLFPEGVSNMPNITLTPEAGVFGRGLYGWAEPLTGDLLNTVLSSLSENLPDKDVTSVYPLLISILNENKEEMGNFGRVFVRIYMKDAMSLNNLYLYHQKNDGVWENLAYTIYEGTEEILPYIEFSTESFSPFLFVNLTDKEDTVSEESEDHTEEELPAEETEKTESSEEEEEEITEEEISEESEFESEEISEDSEPETEEIFSYSGAKITSSVDTVGVDMENSVLSGDAEFYLSAQNDGNTDVYSTLVTETFYLPDGVIIPKEIYTDGSVVYGDGKEILSLSDNGFAEIVDAGASGNSVYTVIETSEYSDLNDAVLVMHGNGFSVKTEEETLYKPIDSAAEATKDVTADDEFLSEEETKAVKDDTLALKVIKTSAILEAGSVIGADAEIDLVSESGNTVSLVAGTNISVDNAEDDFETEEVIALYAPISQGREYAVDPFAYAYSTGILYPVSGVTYEYHGYVIRMTSDNGEYTKQVHMARNTQKDESIYKMVYGGATYNNKRYNLKVYTWSNMPSYSVTNTGLSNDFGSYMSSQTGIISQYGTSDDYNKADARIYQEIHIIDPDTGNEIEWYGIARFSDIDKITSGNKTYTEGYNFSNLVNGNVYTTENTSVVRNGYNGNAWYTGTVNSPDSSYADHTIWVQLHTSASDPLVITYQCPHGLAYNSAGYYNSINFYLDLTHGGVKPRGIITDSDNKITGIDNDIITVGNTNSYKSWDYYTRYGKYKVETPLQIPGYRAVGWGGANNFTNPNTSEYFTPGNYITITGNLKYYVRYIPIVGNVNVTKNIQTNGGSNKTVSGWSFTLSGTSISGDSVSITKTTGSDGVARFTDVPIGTYTITENGVDTGAWTVSPGITQNVTVKDSETSSLTYTNTFKTADVTVTKEVRDPSGLHTSTNGFRFNLSGTSLDGVSVNRVGATSGNGTYIFEDVPAGNYTITEIGTPESPNEVKSYWTVTPSSKSQAFTLGDEDKSVTFTNSLNVGNVTITKTITDPSGNATNLSGFVFNLSGTSDIGDSINKTATTDAQGKAVFSNIPVGTYSVTETDTPDTGSTIPDWWNAWSGSDSVSVTKNGNTAVSANNIYKTGNLHIKKTISGSNASPKGFIFRIFGTSDSGVAVNTTGTTDASGNINIRNIPVGTYTVKEIGTTDSPTEIPSEWTVSPSQRSVTVKYGETAEAAFTNSYMTLKITVINEVEDPTGVHTDPDDFHYTLTGTTLDGNPINRTGVTEDGELVFNDVPAGDYVVTEVGTPESPNEVKDYWTVTPSSKSHTVTLRDTNVTVNFLNVLNVGSVTVTKTVTDPSGNVSNLSGFVFTLSGTAAIGDSINKTATTNAQGKAVFSNIPVGTYSVTETDTPDTGSTVPDWWNAWSGSNSVSVTKNGNTAVSANNIYKTGNLHVKKTVQNSDTGLDGFVFSLSGTSDSGISVNMTGTSDSSGNVSFNNIPIGTYLLKEMGVPGSPTSIPDYWVANPLQQNVTITYGRTTEAAVVNKLMNNSVTVLNEVQDPTGMHEDPDNFKYKLEGTATNGTHIERYGTTDNGTYVFEDVPNGTYTVTEVGTPESQNEIPDYWTVQPLSHQVVVNNSNETVEFLNILHVGTVTVTKTVTDPSGTVTDLSGFVFTLSGTADIGDEISKTATTNSSGKAVFTNIPVGTYSVNETGTPGSANAISSWWEAGSGSDNVIVEKDKNTSLTVNNIYKTGRLQVFKRITDNAASPEGFIFRLYGTSDSGVSIDITKTTNASGTCGFGEIPVGTYRIKEVGTTSSPNSLPSYWRNVTSIEQPITSKYGIITAAVFENALKTGDVSVKKTVTDPSGTVTDLSGFVFTLTGTADNGENVTMTATTNPTGFAYFNNVLVGTYTVTETAAPGSANSIPSWWVVGSGSNSVNVTYNEIKTVTVNNIYKTGNLHVKKTVENSSVGPGGFVFTLTGTSDSGVEVNMTGTSDSSGDVSFSNIPVGTYTLKEVGTSSSPTSVPDYWIVSPRQQQVTITYGNTTEAAVTNKYSTNKVTVLNEVQDPTGAHESPDDFHYILTGTADNGEPVEKTGVTDGGTYVFEDIPNGTYTVTEVGTPESPDEIPDYWTVQPESHQVVVNNSSETVEFLNILHVGTVTVTKTVTDPTGTITDLSGFVFTLSGTASIGDTISKTATTNSEGKAVFSNIPVGTYSVRETGTPGSSNAVSSWWSAGSGSDNVNVTNGGNASVTVNNIYKTGNLHVKKTVTNSTAGVEGFVFSLYGTSDSGKAVQMRGTSNASGDITFSNVPVGTYTIKEIGTTDSPDNLPDYWIPSPAEKQITIAYGKTAEAEFTNAFKSADITVINTVEDPTGTHTDPNDFNYTLVGETVLGEPIEIDGTTEDDGTYVFENVPAGNYTVIETGTPESPDEIPDYWTVIPESHDIVVTDEDITVDFINILNVGTVTVTKTVTDPSGNVTGLSGFVFTLSGTADIGDSISKTATTNAEGKAVFSNILVGTYSVTETDTPDTGNTVPNWWNAWSGSDSVNVTKGGDTTVTANNIYKTGNLHIKKIISGSSISPEGFIFSITGTSDSGIEINTTGTTDASGDININNIPVGTYTVKEIGTVDSPNAVPDIWTVSPEQMSVTVAYGETAEAEFTNTYKTFSVTVINTVEDPTDTHTDPDDFVYVLTGTTDTGDPIEIEGVTEDGKIIFPDVPPGSYTVTEIGTPESPDEIPDYWTVTPESQSFDITDEDVTVEFLNSLDVGTVTVTKSITDPSGTKTDLSGFVFTLSGTADIGDSISKTATTDNTGKAVFTNILVGTYSVKETGVPGSSDSIPGWWAAGSGSDNVTVESGSDTPISVENIYKTGNLHVKKTVVNSKDGLDGFVFTLTGTSDSGEDVSMTGTSDTSGDVSFNNIPIGTYTLKEIGTKDSPTSIPEEWTVSPEEQEVTIVYNETAEAEVVNTKGLDIVIEKTEKDSEKRVVGAHLILSDSTGAEIDSWTTTSEDHTVEGLSAGTYTLVEDRVPTGYVKAEDMTITVINTAEKQHFRMEDPFEVHDLVVTKTVNGNMGNKEQSFEFTVTFTKGSIAELPESFVYEKSDSSGIISGGTASLSGGRYTFTLGHGESIRFKDVPYDTSYAVSESETSSAGYRVSKTNDTGKITTSDKTAEFVNTKNTGVPTLADTWTLSVSVMFILAAAAIIMTFFIKRRKITD